MCTMQSKDIYMIYGRFAILPLHNPSKEWNLYVISKYALVDKAHPLNDKLWYNEAQCVPA